MRIGIDLDNTIICYDELFHRLAMEQGLILPDVAKIKRVVRDYLRAGGQEDAWTSLQGEAYGPRIDEAGCFEGVVEAIGKFRSLGWTVCIISHKTRRPAAGGACDLHAAAMGWLERQGFFDADGGGLSCGDVYLEVTLDAKLERIAGMKCDMFIDDLVELLMHKHFPVDVRAVLFDPHEKHAAYGQQEGEEACVEACGGMKMERLSRWADALGLISPVGSRA